MAYLLIPSREWLVTQTNRNHPVLVRRARPDDVSLLARLLINVSARSRELRYMLSAPVTDEWLSREVRRIAAAPSDRAVALVATVEAAGREEAVAVAELVRDPHAAGAAEIAVVVRDDWQRQGLGTLLLRELVGVGRAWGLATLRADTLADNYGAQRLIRALDLPVTMRQGGGERHFEIALAGATDLPHSMYGRRAGH